MGANRTVSVAMRLLVRDYEAAAEKAAKSTDQIGKSATRSAAEHRRGMDSIVQGAGAAALAGTAALGAMVLSAANFDKAMSGVAAVSNASATEMKALREAALQAGADTAFSATEAAQAEAELAKAGVSTSDILGGALKGSLSLAAAGQLSVADSATIAAQAMNIWKLSGSQVSHVADVLASGANKSAADVGDLGDAMRMGGMVAAQMGIGLEDTVGVLSAFADRALVGSDAGTSLKTMLQRLAAPTAEASTMMQHLGISAYDASGKFVGMAQFAGNLQRGLSGLSEQEKTTALATIFGSDAVRAATVLMGLGASGVKEYTSAVNDQGAASRMASTQMDNLSGDLEQLRGSLETALIKGGSEATGMLRGLTQGATALVNGFGDLPGPLQASAMGLLAVGTAGTGALAAIGTIAPRIREARLELAAMGTWGERANRAIGVMGKAFGASIPIIGAAAAITAYFSSKKAEERAAVDAAAEAIKADNMALGENTRRQAAATMEQRGMLSAAQTLGIGLDTLTDAVLGNAQAQDQVRERVAQAGAAAQDTARRAGYYSEATNRQADAAKNLRINLGGMIDTEKSGVAQAQRLSEASGQAKGSTDKVAGAAKGAATSLREEASAADQLKSKLDALNATNLTAAEKDISFRNATAQVTEAVKNNGSSLDLNTQKGRDNTSAILTAIRAAEEHAQAVADQTGSVQKGSRTFQQHMEQLRKVAIAAGLPRKAVDDLIKTYGRVPQEVKTKVQAQDNATSKINNVEERLKRINGLTSTVYIDELHRSYSQSMADTASQYVPGHRASGGPVTAGQPYWVGETGPELIVPSTSGYVIPHGYMPAGTASSGASYATVTINGALDPLAVGEQVERALTRLRYSRGQAPLEFQR